MTIVVAIKCTDGAVIAADSMITVGGTAQQTGQKIHTLPGTQEQLFAFAGDLGFAERFRAIATDLVPQLPTSHKLIHASNVGATFVANIQSTGISPLQADLATVLAFVKDNTPEVCLFLGGSQPRFLDQNHYSCAIGSGSVAANPFLKFLSDTLLENRQPTLAEGKLLAVWAINYSIQTMAGGVGLPIDVATIEGNGIHGWVLRDWTQEDVWETIQAIGTGTQALRDWRNALSASSTGEEIPLPPPPSVKG